MSKKIRIGAATGYYGDSIWPAIKSAREGNIQYLCFDALAELTMAILQKDRQKNADGGFAKDLVPFMQQLLPICKEKGIKILTNAGGVNPHSAKRAVQQVVKDLGLDLKVAVVAGDDLMDQIGVLTEQELFINMQSGRAFDPLAHEIRFANAYLGAKPLVDALSRGADIVISGRTTDAAQFAAPMIYEFGWQWDDWDLLAKAMTIGHLLECSGQAVGGNFSGDWKSIDFMDIGYPIAEVDESGEAVITKVPNSGGLVSRDTLKEQLLYEIHDPFHYVLPEVVVNIASTQLEDIGENQVRVYGTMGKPAPQMYKALIGYANGFMGEATRGYCWPDALEKAQRTAEIVQEHLNRADVHYKNIDVSYLGHNSLQGVLASNSAELNEVFLRIAIHVESRHEAEKLGKIMNALTLSGPPFTAGGGAQKPRELLGICPILVPKEIIDQNIVVEVD